MVFFMGRNLPSDLDYILLTTIYWTLMETNTLIIVIGTLFTLALILSGWVIIGLAQRNKTKVLLEHQRLQISRQKRYCRKYFIVSRAREAETRLGTS